MHGVTCNLCFGIVFDNLHTHSCMMTKFGTSIVSSNK
uniref:Uncharacterized protein n=1 Tax=Arundo donax TaxID=35708 RepID=A0A0A9FYR9_ARUDO